ncbi:hypothetical protein [Algoriphagus lacus]|uniref:hypothetical protein n=1 Tax=Algoriphagus lacus TaxID=2056311 RepID=UPI001314BD39|nr:hypothetical protein [Algoriphagus lacus]
MKRKEKGYKSKSLISKIIALFTRKKPHSKGNNFKLWKNDELERGNTTEVILKEIK